MAATKKKKPYRKSDVYLVYISRDGIVRRADFHEGWMSFPGYMEVEMDVLPLFGGHIPVRIQSHPCFTAEIIPEDVALVQAEVDRLLDPANDGPYGPSTFVALWRKWAGR